jgi:hypothetical protein
VSELSLIIGGTKPENIRDFIIQFAEALLTFLFQRFDIDQGHLETSLIEVLEAIDEFVPAEAAATPPAAGDPIVLAMTIAENAMARELFLPEGPRTVELLTEGTIGLVKKLAVTQFVIGEIFGDIIE